MSQSIRVAFVGNPNCGKTTLFNAYTGAKHKVANWPGVTVEKKEGTIRHDGHTMRLVDLPGIYSISPYSTEEILTRDYILNYDPDVIVNIVDANNLERNLYLTLQLIELGKPVVLALNMMDILEQKGVHIDTDILESEMKIPVVPVSGFAKKGLKTLLHQIIRSAKHKVEYEPLVIDYGDDLEEHILKISDQLDKYDFPNDYSKRWLAIKILEQDKEIIKRVTDIHIEHEHSEAIVNTKYDYISTFIHDALSNDKMNEETLSDRIDSVATHPVWGVPIFLLLMAGVFLFTFTVGNYLAGLFDALIGSFAAWTYESLTGWGVAGWLVSMIVDGAIGGVGGIMIFLPNIACLFLAMSILEDSGYMARVAFIMDRYMKRIGLNGRAFIPMILGFGCSVPAIMTARTLEDEKDRLITIMITPFMSCSARLPIYVLFSRAFFPGKESLVAFSLYFLGIIVAIVIAVVFKAVLKRGKSRGLILELPEYKRPAFRTTGLFVYDKVKGYILRAGTVIFVASVLLWFMLNYNLGGAADITDSIGASIGKMVEPVFRPLGFGTWQAALALIAGVMGKEIVVSTMAVIYGIGQEGLSAMLASVGFTALSAYAFMVFSLLYTPCVATLGVVKKETNSWSWTAFSFFYQLGVAWLVAAIVYQLGRLVFA